MLHITQGAHYKHEKLLQQTIGATEAALTAPTAPVVNPENIFVQAHPSNTGNIVVGFTGVAADGSAGGYVLAPGSNMNLPGVGETAYYIIATAANQKLQIAYHRGVI